MSQIFKVNHVNGTEIKHIYIFTGSRHFKTDNYGPDGEKVFTSDEWANISTNDIPVTLIPHYIHADDTINIIKKKIIKYVELHKSTKQLYLFAIKQKEINPTLLFNELSQGNEIDVTHQKLCQYLMNIVRESKHSGDQTICDDIFQEVKETYDYDDLLSFQNFEWNEEKYITEPIGQKLVIKRRYPFVANPYNVYSQDPLIHRDINNILTTQGTNLLFEYGNLIGNNIFVCYADEVLQYAAQEEHLTEKYMCSLFFPFLSSVDKIHSLSQLRDRAAYLYDDQKKTIEENFVAYNKNIDMFYDMFFTKTTQLDYLEHTPGISSIEFTIHPLYNIHFPLEILFKLIHSTKDIPMIKYNPGKNRENIYRFYANKIATNGKKIPYLFTTNGNKKGLIMKLSKLIATKKKVGFYISIEKEDEDYNIICEFTTNGNINVVFQPGKPLSIDQLQEIIREAINEPILNKISDYLGQSGYSYISFDNLEAENIEIHKIEYVSALVIKKNVHLKKLIKCLSPIFNIIEGDLTKKNEKLFLQYKRVSNYNEMDAKETFINQLRRQERSIEEIIRELMDNFNMTEQASKLKVANWISNVRTEAAVFENKDITIRTNTGFPIVIKRDKHNFQTVISVDLIDNVHYIRYIHIYIDSLLRIITQRKSSALTVGGINKLCKGKRNVEMEEDQEDIQAEVEKGFLEHKTAVINNNKVMFVDELDEQREQRAAFLDLLLGDESDDESDEDDDSIEFGEEIGDDFSLSLGSPPKEKSATPKSPTPQSIENLSLSASPVVVPSADSPADSSDDSPADSSSEAEVDLTGLPLKGAQNIFLSKKLRLQPELFLKRPQGRFTAYSKACPAQYAKQPVMLTNTEKTYIDKQDSQAGTKSYDEYITYGTGDAKYHYICPRFWCLSDEEGKQRSISFKEINEGQCGGWDALIPDGSAKVPEGKRIFEFTDPRFHKEKTKKSNLLVYKPMYPGFIPPHKHPNNLCIPCCFGKPTTKEGFKKEIPFMYKPVGKPHKDGLIGPTYQTNKDGSINLETIKGVPQIKDAPAKKRLTTYDECNQTSGVAEESTKQTKTKKVDAAPLLDRFPLDSEQLGYLPIAVQRFLGYNCKKLCQHSANNKQLKLNQPCLLHKGMIKSETQSFLACIADAYQYEHNEKNFKKAITLPNKPHMTIEDLKAIIVERLTLDVFITLQNGVLIELFVDEDLQTNIDAYKDSQLYKTLESEMDNEASTHYFKRIVSAYENFIKYINDPTIIINYEYLWDFITTPMAKEGGGLFTNGINLIILRSPGDDITDKIELICPTNHYASNAYDVNKKILILYNRGNYYEPIYKYTRQQKNKYLIRKLFYLPDMKKIMPEIERIMSFIWKNLVTKCQPLPSMPERYNNSLHFKENISSSAIIRQISKETLGYTVKSQIVNFETKVIGILASNKGDQIYIPCRPSNILIDIPYTYVHDPDMWGPYDSTRDQLALINAGTKGKILCKPMIKVVDNNVIIGIITETNQMVPTHPEPYQAPLEGGQEVDGLKTIHLHSEGDGGNFLQIDEDTLMNTAIDEDRIIKVKQIQLESNFYNIFRNLLRIVLTNYEHKREKEQLLEIIESPVILYQDKLARINTTLHTLLSNRIEFSQLNISTLEDVQSVTQCLGLDEAPCNRETVCTFSVQSNKCILQLPKKNLINGTDNEVTYYGRLSDELIRYSRIQTYIFKPKTFLSFQEVNYQLRDNEIILLEEILYGDYFVDLIAIHPNPFIQSKSVYDLVEPQRSVPYETRYNLDILLQPQDVNPCVIEAGMKSNLSLGHWKDGKLIRTKEVVKNPDGKMRIIRRSHREAPLLEGYNLQEFKHTFNCSWEIFAAILSNFKGEAVAINSIREDLIRKYSTLFGKGRKEQILDVLKKEGKRDQVDAIESGTSIVDIITMSNYYLSLVDIFILSKIYKLPCAVLCRTNIPSFHSEMASFIQSNNDFIYLIFSGIYHKVDSNTSPVYGLISKDDSIRIPNAYLPFYDTLMRDNVETMDAFIARMTLGEKQHKQNIKIKKLKKKLVVRGTRKD